MTAPSLFQRLTPNPLPSVRLITALLFAVSIPLSTSRLGAAEDLVVADFEGPDYGTWTASGEAFGKGPAHGPLPGQMAVDGYQGKGLVNSFVNGDGSTGTLTSPEFRIERPFISFLIGGGRIPGKTALRLMVDDVVAREASGSNTQPGGTETLGLEFWDVSNLQGKTARLQILDQATGGWGHINVDQIVQTDRKPEGPTLNASREFQVRDRYLLLPIRNGAPKRVVTLLVDGSPVVRNDVELADGTPDWWAPLDVGAWKNRTLTLQVDRLPPGSTSLSSIQPSETYPDAGGLYREPLRGQFHFSPRRGWNNDPNGLVYFNGEYHLFFQHNPYGWSWGNMHWGHAVSRDLVHWEELGDVLAPDPLGPMFSGSAVVDRQNTSGLGTPEHPPLVLIYTAAGDPTVQCIASSTDGRHFTKYPGNPVLRQVTGGNRDPKVFWHDPTHRWVMPLYVETNKIHTIHFFGSPNLKDWTFLSRSEGYYECPDFFELPVDGSADTKKWVLTAASSEYQVGTFDGTRFTPETPKLPGHRGRGFYAAQTFSDLPSSDGRRIQIGWFQTETKGMPFNQSMTIPFELRLTATPEGPRLTWTPVRELESLRKTSQSFGPIRLAPGAANPLGNVSGELVEFRADFEPGPTTETLFNLRGAQITYHARTQELEVQGLRVPAPLRNSHQRLTVYCDRTGLEIFASDGLTYIPFPFQPVSTNRSLSVESRSGTSDFQSLDVHELGSAWPTP